jgi:hypothetical protein
MKLFSGSSEMLKLPPQMSLHINPKSSYVINKPEDLQR